MKASEIARHLREVGLPAVAAVSAPQHVPEGQTGSGTRVLPPLGMVSSRNAGIVGVYGDASTTVLIAASPPHDGRLEFAASQFRLLDRTVLEPPTQMMTPARMDDLVDGEG